MALDLTGIHNVGEFYSHHYLDAVLEGDLKAVFDRWKEREQDGGPKSPEKRLAALAEDYFKASHAAENLRGPEAEVQVERWRLARGFHLALLEALGYPLQPGAEPLEEEGLAVPVLTALARDVRPYLWAVEAPFPGEEDESVLETPPLPEQMPTSAEGARVPEETWQDLLDGAILRQEAAPRWVLLLGGRDVFLIDRTKWGQGKHLRFELGELLGRKDRDALRAMAGLLHRDVLSPDDGTCLHDQLEENSHKHAFGVSTDLKHGARRAIELLANEAVHYLRYVSKDRVFETDDLGDSLARELTDDALRYLYRLLFLFFVESRAGELELAPMKSDAYRLGYSLETLRDLEQVPLTSVTAREGYYLDQSLRTLFRLVNEGFPTTSKRVERLRQQRAGASRSREDYNPDQGLLDLGFDLAPQGKQLKLDLGTGDEGRGPRPAAAPAARGMQSVLGLQWGGEEEHDEDLVTVDFTIQGLRSPLFDDSRLNRMGKVKFRNFVLQEVLELLSLSRPGKSKTRGRISYATLGINQLGAVYEGLLSYTGFFARSEVYEVRSESDVKKEEARTYFLPVERAEEFRDEEFIRDEDGKRIRHAKGAYLFRLAGRDRKKTASYYTPEVLTRCLTKYTLKERLKDVPADEILDLTICEPAMGSGAFLNEAVNQLADAYLERKQKELGKTIPSEQYQAEKQKVKYHVAVHNCYGVDRNPPATELGKLSLWLNILQPTKDAPTPFFGARIRVGNSLIGARRQIFRAESLTAKAKGKRWLDLVPEKVPFGTDLPEDGIWHFLVPDEGMVPFDKDKVVADLEPENVKLIKAWRKEILKPYSTSDVEALQRISRRVDELWNEHAAERQKVLERLRQPCYLWGQPPPADPRPKSVEECEEALRALEHPNSAYGRLKAVMDYWCALWFWPVQDATLLSTRDEMHFDTELMLNDATLTEQRTTLASVVARYRFFHWELEFTEALGEGFDLLLGNPPWVALEWAEQDVLADFDPAVDLRSTEPPTRARERRSRILSEIASAIEYLNQHNENVGSLSYLGAASNFPLLKGLKTNLYKCFLTLSWEIGSHRSKIGLLHQPAIFDDPTGGNLRRETYRRLRFGARFTNELQLFESVGHARPFCFTVCDKNPRDNVNFSWISNLFHPNTIDESVDHNGEGPTPGIQTEDGDWDIRGHRSRIIHIDEDVLRTYHRLFEDGGDSATPDTQKSPRLPVIHSKESGSVLRRFSETRSRLRDHQGSYWSTVCFHETSGRDEGILSRGPIIPQSRGEWVLTGPHIHVGNPLYKEPRPLCRSKNDYDVIDLSASADDRLPRTLYHCTLSRTELEHVAPQWHKKSYLHSFRHIHRRRVFPGGERTFLNAIIPPEATHVHTLLSTVFESSSMMAISSGMAASLPFDFLVKSTGKEDAYEDLFSLVPLPDCERLTEWIKARALRLNCVTNHYSTLWSELFRPDWSEDSFSKADDRLGSWSCLTPEWHRGCALRLPYERRQALVEIDAIASLAIGMTPNDLGAIYRIQFPVLHQYERETYYDQRGQIVFTVNRGLPGVGLDRKQWEEVRYTEASGTLPSFAAGYVPPFERCDREEDMASAYHYFDGLLRTSEKK